MSPILTEVVAVFRLDFPIVGRDQQSGARDDSAGFVHSEHLVHRRFECWSPMGLRQ